MAGAIDAAVPLNTARAQTVRRQLSHWFAAVRRDLPWRRRRDPYAIWISEVMLQQTRVETVIPYYRRFLRRFPSLAALAKAGEAAVLKQWEGLGYYRRARNLLAAAKEISEKRGGQWPEKAAALRELPGFGPYTAAAVASIAFAEPVAAVDGNVRRVLARLSASAREVRVLAEQLVPRKNPGDHNQALMELGARVCLPQKPRCGECPLQKQCGARRAGRVDRFPWPGPKRKALRRYAAVLVLRRKGKLFARRRPAEGLWGGMWECPTWLASRRPNAAALRKKLRAQFQLTAEEIAAVGSFAHSLTHRELSVVVFQAAVSSAQLGRGGAWVSPCALRAKALSRLQYKAIALACGKAGFRS